MLTFLILHPPNIQHPVAFCLAFPIMKSILVDQNTMPYSNIFTIILPDP